MSLGPRTRRPHWCPARSSLLLFPAHFPQPAVDGLSPRSNSGSSDAAILGKCVLVADRPDADALAIAITLKKQTVPHLNPQHPANLDGYGDLSLACDFGLLLHDGFQFLTLAHFPYISTV